MSVFDTSINVRFSPCMHRQVITETTGSRRIVDGEVWDDICERLVCLDCGEYVTEEEVRAAWGQVPQELPLPKEEVSHADE